MSHADKYFGMPGPGGALGKCALCGDNFLVEIIMAKTVQSFGIDGIKQTLFGHDKCIKDLKANIARNGTALVADLPDGPLKQSMQPKEKENDDRVPTTPGENSGERQKIDG